jgi:hypothetical protein
MFTGRSTKKAAWLKLLFFNRSLFLVRYLNDVATVGYFGSTVVLVLSGCVAL